MKVPVSVVLPIKNMGETLQETLESISRQHLKDFEVLMIIADSFDESLSIAESVARFDRRFKVIKFYESKNLSQQLNLGISLSQGNYIAIANADDIYLQNRLSSQVMFLDANKEVDILGSNMKTFGLQKKVFKYPISHHEIVSNLMFTNSIGHPTVMMRRNLTIQRLEYSQNFQYCEDFELWNRIRGDVKFANLNIVTTYYRLHSRQVTQEFSKEASESMNRVLMRNLMKFEMNRMEDFAILRSIADSKGRSKDMWSWLEKLIYLNRLKGIYDEVAFANTCRRLFHLCDSQ
jgi:glycosyltransferase involved in cell wall biosynthesis